MKYAIFATIGLLLAGCNEETNNDGTILANSVKEIHKQNFREYCEQNNGKVDTVRDSVNQLKCVFQDGSELLDK